MSDSSHDNQTSETVLDPYSDPVAFLANCGIQAELVQVITRLPEAA